MPACLFHRLGLLVDRDDNLGVPRQSGLTVVGHLEHEVEHVALLGVGGDGEAGLERVMLLDVHRGRALSVVLGRLAVDEPVARDLAPSGSYALPLSWTVVPAWASKSAVSTSTTGWWLHSS